MKREFRIPVFLPLVMVLLVAGCGKKPEPVAASHQAEPAEREDPDAARREAEERARREAEERTRREAEEAARLRTTLEQMVFFDFDMAEIRPDAKTVLDEKVKHLRADPTIRMRIEGHADERGSIEYNLALGHRRAEAVKGYFSLFTLDPSRFETISYGEERPLVDEHDEVAWAKNRRAEFYVLGGGKVAEGSVAPSGR